MTRIKSYSRFNASHIYSSRFLRLTEKSLSFIIPIDVFLKGLASLTVPIFFSFLVTDIILRTVNLIKRIFYTAKNDLNRDITSSK